MSDQGTESLIELARALGILREAGEAKGERASSQAQGTQSSAGGGTSPAGDGREAVEDAGTAELLALARRVGLPGFSRAEHGS